MEDTNQLECNYERDKALTECLTQTIELSSRLEAMASGDATWPRVGTLLSVRQRLVTILDMVPTVEPSTEVEQIAEAGRRG